MMIMMNAMIGIVVLGGVAVILMMIMRTMNAVRDRELESLSRKEKMQKPSLKGSLEETTTTTTKITDADGRVYATSLGMIGTENPPVEGVQNPPDVGDISSEKRCSCHGWTYAEMVRHRNG
jgi:predicted small secreted protein